LSNIAISMFYPIGEFRLRSTLSDLDWVDRGTRHRGFAAAVTCVAVSPRQLSAYLLVGRPAQEGGAGIVIGDWLPHCGQA